MTYEVGDTIYIHFGLNTYDNGERALTWKCPRCLQDEEVSAHDAPNKMVCMRCGTEVTAAPGLLAELRATEGHSQGVEILPSGRFTLPESWRQPVWYGIRMWKYTVTRSVEKMPSKMLILMGEEDELGEDRQAEADGTPFSIMETLNTLWEKDPIEDWEESEAARAGRMDRRRCGPSRPP